MTYKARVRTPVVFVYQTANDVRVLLVENAAGELEVPCARDSTVDALLDLAGRLFGTEPVCCPSVTDGIGIVRLKNARLEPAAPISGYWWASIAQIRLTFAGSPTAFTIREGLRALGMKDQWLVGTEPKDLA